MPVLRTGTSTGAVSVIFVSSTPSRNHVVESPNYTPYLALFWARFQIELDIFSSPSSTLNFS